MYGLALRGEYSIATRFAPMTSSPTPLSKSCHRRYTVLAEPGRWSSDAGSMAWTSFFGSPVAGTK